MKKKGLYWILFLLIVLDLGYSFRQYISEPIDGDVPGIVLPSDWYTPILSDPFGIGILLNDKKHAGANRYFVHRSMSTYLKEAPKGLQLFLKPINSVYWAIGLLKLFCHLLILGLLATYISGSNRVGSFEFMMAAFLVTPLFQANGAFNHYIGIVHSSVTYVFFYALPIGLLGLFYWPFFKRNFGVEKTAKGIGMMTTIGIIFLMIVLAFSGPLIQPIVILICLMSLMDFYWKRITKQKSDASFLEKSKVLVQIFSAKYLWYFIGFSLLCGYSFYIGTFNIENGKAISLVERFGHLGEGLIKLLTGRIVYPVLLIFVLINLFLIRRFPNHQVAEAIRLHGQWILFFSIIYIFLLPFGGYRDYRPGIVRADTLMPVVLGLFYFYGKSTLFLIQNLKPSFRKYYLVGVGILTIIFTLADIPNFQNNECEKRMLATIANSKEKLVRLDKSCFIMSWDIKTNPKRTEDNCELLLYWNILKEKKRYSQR